MIPVPQSPAEIKMIFGDIETYIDDDGTLNSEWERDWLDMFKLPQPLKLSWGTGVAVNMRCHRLLVPTFKEVYEKIHREGLWNEIEPYGGCFQFRRKTNSEKLSTHCWGIAVDHRPNENRFETRGTMNPRVIEIFKEHGFTWGGDWLRNHADPMHFQYCQGF